MSEVPLYDTILPWLLLERMRRARRFWGIDLV